MKKITLFSFFLFLVFTSKAQLTITDSLSDSVITNLLQGMGVTISNLSVNCNPQAIGQFNGTSEMSITHGLALSTGDVNNIAGPNTVGSMTTTWGTPGDPSLDSLIAPVTTLDGCVLNFDALPTNDTMWFNFSFGSEEYPEFVFSGFNDVFAILLNGPGISGTINAATLPSGIPVTINNVNDSVNSAYYYNNESPAGIYSSFDGFTTNLTAFAQVIPDSLYHFKVAIADAGDDAYDSGVMLEAFSFRCVFLNTMGIKDEKETSNYLSVYPNPGTGIYSLKDKDHKLKNATISIINVLGEEINSQLIENEAAVIDLTNQPTGIYFIRVTSGEEVFNTKLIKK